MSWLLGPRGHEWAARPFQARSGVTALAGLNWLPEAHARLRALPASTMRHALALGETTRSPRDRPANHRRRPRTLRRGRCPVAMRIGRRPWLLALVMACVPGAPDTETPDGPPNDPPPARLAPAPLPPAPESIEAMCADLDADDDRIQVRIVDALDTCTHSALTGCTSDTTYYLANCSDDPVEVQMLGNFNAYQSGTFYALERASSGSGRIAPHTVWSLSVGYFNDPDDRLRIDIVDAQGAPIRLRDRPVRVSDPARLAALAVCDACEGIWDHRDDRGCNCKTHDAGQACDDDDVCEGDCLFDHWQVSTPAPRPRCKGKHCAAMPSGIGRPIGRCSLRVSTSCDHFLEPGIAARPDQPLPWGVDWRCGCTGSGFDPANLERSASGRRARGEPASHGSTDRAHEPPVVTPNGAR